MAMNATDELQKEHRFILAMIEIIGELCNRLERDGTADPGHLAAVIDFIRTFADGCHHAKEERALFPALEAAGIPRENGPVGVMLAEHDAGRRFVTAMDATLDGIRAGDAAAARDFIANARGYMELLVKHIHKEDEVLFVLADRYLSPDEQERLVREFERIERDETGAGAHERYHALLHELRGVYLDGRPPGTRT